MTTKRQIDHIIRLEKAIDGVATYSAKELKTKSPKEISGIIKHLESEYSLMLLHEERDEMGL